MSHLKLISVPGAQGVEDSCSSSAFLVWGIAFYQQTTELCAGVAPGFPSSSSRELFFCWLQFLQLNPAHLLPFGLFLLSQLLPTPLFACSLFLIVPAPFLLLHPCSHHTSTQSSPNLPLPTPNPQIPEETSEFMF